MAAATLPRLNKSFDPMSRGFAREGVFQQGVYQPGGQPTLYDPSWTRQRVPEAVLRHEEVHQNLTQQTFHGVLTLILTEYGKVANARATLEACYREQWVVQELGATYAELAFVQRVAPEAFSASVNALPSAEKGGEPYREAFDFANWLLPLDDAAWRERSDPRTFVIAALCNCSMATACLRQLASSDFDDARFASWITSNSPHARLEQIARAAGPASFLEMTQVATRRFSQGQLSQRIVRELFDELSGVMLGHIAALTAEPLSQLETQAHAAVDRLRKDCPGFEFDLAESLRSKGPLYTDSPDKRELLERRLEQQITFDEATVIDAWLQACQTAGGLHIISGLPDPAKAPSMAFVCIPSFPGNPIPNDLRVRLRPDQFFECVKRFPGFPNVITMIGDGWLYWNAYLTLPESNWARQRIDKAIRITVHKSLSRPLLLQLLVHQNLYDGARCILLELADGRGVALFDNPKVNAVYALQMINSELTLAELREFLKQNNVEQIKDPRSVVDFELLYWIIEREFQISG